MAKKVRFRLWFHKLNIKRFSNPSHPVLKRRNFGLSPPAPSLPPLDTLGFSAPSSSPFQSRHSSSSPDHISVSLLSSPCHSLPVAFSSPRHILPTSFCSPRHSLPATSLSRHGRIKALRPSKLQANFSSAVLLSPINCKALDIAFPSGGSSPAAYTLLQSPTLQATASAATSPAVNVFSPPICKPHTVLFKSPLHPALAHQSSVEKPTIEPKMFPATANGRNRKVFSASQSPAARGAVKDESTHLIKTAGNRAAHQKRWSPARNSLCLKQSPFIVDCGCHPSFSSSFRKTKKTLQACGSCSGSNEPGIIPIHNNLNQDATQKHCGRGGVKSSGESRNFIDPRCGEDDPCPGSLGTQGPKKVLIQRRKKKKRTETAEISITVESPKSLLKQQDFGPTTPLMIGASTFDANLREIEAKKGTESAICDPAISFCSSSTTTRDGAASLMEARTLAWEKDFSSFTSEDTFFSSFERSRPSFSSNSSSECFDRKIIYSKPASNLTTVVPNDANVLSNHALAAIKRCATEDLNSSNPALSSASSANSVSCVRKDAKVTLSQSSVDRHAFDKLQHTLKSMGCKERDPLVEVSFNAVDRVCEGEEAIALRGDTSPFCTDAACPCEQPLHFMTSSRGTRRSTLSPLVKIKEDSCEDGSTDTAPDQLNRVARSSRKSKSSLKDLNSQEKLSLNPDYTTSCHSDYYASVRANLQKSARVRKKSTEVRKSKGGSDMGSARIRRRAHMQARWRLSNEQTQWQSSGVDEDIEHDVGCAAALSSQLMHLNLNDRSNLHMPNNPNRPRRRRSQEIKQENTELINASTEALSKASSNPLQTSASRANARAAAVDDSTTKVCEAERIVELTEDQSGPNVKKQSSYIANNPRLVDSVAVVKSSKDPLVDFRESMVDMIIERQIYSASDLRELLQCFLSLNAREHHDVIVQAFGQVWAKLFHQEIGSS